MQLKKQIESKVDSQNKKLSFDPHDEGEEDPMAAFYAELAADEEIKKPKPQESDEPKCKSSFFFLKFH